jgi:hypothetical protein
MNYEYCEYENIFVSYERGVKVGDLRLVRTEVRYASDIRKPSTLFGKPKVFWVTVKPHHFATSPKEQPQVSVAPQAEAEKPKQDY